MIKAIDVTVDRKYGARQLLTGLVSVPAWQCNVLHGLLVTGYLTTPPRHRPLGLSTYWAWLRYGAAVSRRKPGLRLRSSWTDLDPHQKTILSDDFGLGFPSYFLVDRHGFEDFADTVHLLDTMFRGSVTHRAKSKRGPAKSPDLIAVDSVGHLHVLECKGTQTARNYLRAAVERGQAQKRNIQSASSGFFKSCMVGGIFIPQCAGNEDAELLFIDPEPDPRLRLLEELPHEEVAAAVRRHSFAKGLAVCGLWGSATAVDLGELSPEELARVRQIETGEINFNGFAEHDLGWRRSIEYRAIDNSRDEGGAFITQLTIDVPRTLTDFIRQTVNNQGKLPSAEVDAWLANQTRERRQGNGIGKRLHPSKSNTLTKSRPSAWRFDHGQDDEVQASASVTLPSGLCFSLSLRQVE